ncbi:MAG TPA: hypothetical protein VFQ44_17010 [Streptosporangiaceae bacterium]|nr:hypothetical protein [Streptosporangiaceae bacterium]
MRVLAARIGDALLTHLLPAGEAGACIVGAGTKCKCGSPCGVDYCTQYFLSCFGVCTKDTGVHC